MILKSSYICIDNLRFHARHGVLPQEQLTGGTFTVSLRMGYPVEKAMETDRVEDTLNYADAAQVVKTEMEKPSKLIEHVAGRIAKALFRHFPKATSIDLKLTKHNPPMGGQSNGASVELHLINDKTE